MIITDSARNQFTAFYPGPSQDPSYLDKLRLFLAERKHQFEFVVIAPDIARNVRGIQQLCYQHDLPFLCDPGQCITDYTTAEMFEIASASKILCLNHYEYEILTRTTSWQCKDDQWLIVTNSKKGIRYRHSGVWHNVRAVKAMNEVDPTGCGDAFRAGLIHGLLNGATQREAIESGATVAAINIEHLGIQNHSLDSYRECFASDWNSLPSWLSDDK